MTRAELINRIHGVALRSDSQDLAGVLVDVADDLLGRVQGLQCSDTPPTTPGYYWLRVGGRLGAWQVVRVIRMKRPQQQPELRILYAGLDGSESLAERMAAGVMCEWAGPISGPTGC